MLPLCRGDARGDFFFTLHLMQSVQRAPKKVQKYGLEWLYRISQNPKGYSKRVLRALFPCMKIFIKHLFEPRKQDF